MKEPRYKQVNKYLLKSTHSSMNEPKNCKYWFELTYLQSWVSSIKHFLAVGLIKIGMY